MSEKVKNKSEHRCKICDKAYASASSLCNHNNKYHLFKNKPIVKTSNDKILPDNNTVKVEEDKQYSCKYCNKLFAYKQSKYDHQKNYCKVKDKINKDTENELKITENELKITENELKMKEMELQLKIKENEILKLKLQLQKSKTADIVTVNQLNKLLLERHNQYQNYVNNLNGNIHNGNNVQNIVNNFQLVGFGKEEDITEKLTKKEKKQIINSRYKCLEKIIEIVHCGKYDQFKNILVTNIKDNYMFRYDENKGQFVLATKDEVIHSLIDNRMYELEIIYDELLEDNKLDEKTKDIIEDFINKLNNDAKYTDSDGKEHKTYKQYKVNEIKLILYNNKDKITNDISLLLKMSDYDCEKE